MASISLETQDKKARQDALDLRQSFIVQAPAGSGKTSLLINRYLSLLAQVTTPDTIVIITFTKKAVYELQERIITLLKHNKNPPPAINTLQKQTQQLATAVLAQSKKYQWRLTEQPNRLRIMTIDALSNEVVKQHAQFEQLNLSQNILDTVTTQQCYQQSVLNVLSLIHDKSLNPPIIKTLEFLDNNTTKFISLFVNMLKKRDQWLRHIYHQTDQALQETINHIIKHHLISAAKEMVKITQTSIDLNQLAGKNIDVTDLDFFISIADKLLTKSDTAKKRSKQEKALALIIEGTPLVKELALCRRLPEHNNYDITGEIITVLKLCLAQLKILFAEKNQCDFIEIAIQSVDILSHDDTPSRAFLSLEHGLDHLLIDEFQDTSTTQFKFIESLLKSWQKSDGKTLFLVGDPMQSIYRFREAKVGLFTHVWQQLNIGEISLNQLSLRQNFRSLNTLVEQHNICFKYIFPTQSDQHSGAVAYSPSISTLLGKTSCLPIDFCLFDSRHDTAEANKVADIIQDEQAIDNQQSIAVLVRSRSHLKEIIYTLTKRHITFEALNIHSLAHNPYIKDLVSLSCALTNLSDRLSWLSLMRSPWCGLCLADLLWLSQNNTITIWQSISQLSLNKTNTGLSQEGEQRLLMFHHLLSPAIQNIGKVTIKQLLLLTISRLQIRSFLHESNQNALQVFLTLVDELLDNQQPICRQTLNQHLIYKYEQTQPAQVKLMTIFSAKGLEFDCVILPGLGRKLPYDEKSLLPFLELEFGLLYAPIKANTSRAESKTYQYITQHNKQQNAHELTRLLYVAMTRAKCKNYLLGHIANPDSTPADGSFLLLLWSVYQAEFLNNIQSNQSQNKPKKTVALFERVPALCQINDLKNTKIQENHALKNNQLQYEQQQQKCIGILVHQYLEHHRIGEKLSLKKIKQDLLSAGIAITNLNPVAAQVMQLLQNLYTADFYAWLFAPYKHQFNEYVFIDKNQKSIIIDRLFIDKNTVWIIDYKTTSPHSNQSKKDFIDQQKQQYQPQLKTYTNIIKQYYDHPVKTALCLLAIPCLLEV